MNNWTFFFQQAYREYLNDDVIKNVILDVFFLIVILARWFIPKGQITLVDLSKLLLINITLISDILDMMKIIRDLRFTKCIDVFGVWLYILGLVSLCLSILELSLGLTATRNPRFHSIKRNGRFLKSYEKIVPEIVINDERIKAQKWLRIWFSRLPERFGRFKNFITELTIKFFEKEIWSKIFGLVSIIRRSSQLFICILLKCYWKSITGDASWCPKKLS